MFHLKVEIQQLHQVIRDQIQEIKKITNLQDGTDKTDAVNYGQLKAVETKLSKQGDKTLTFEANNSITAPKFVRKKQ